MNRIIGRQATDGYVMVLVLIVMTLITILCLMLLTSASMLLGTARNTSQKEQCRILAVSLSRAIGEQIVYFSYSEPPDPDPGNSDSSLQDRLQTVVTASWEAGEVFTYQLEYDDLPGITTVELSWIDSDGSLTGFDFTEGADLAEAAEAFEGVRLYVTITSTIGKDASSVISVYRPVVETDITGADDNTDPDNEGEAGSGGEIEIINDIAGEAEGELEGEMESEIADEEAETIWTTWNWEYAGSSWEGECGNDF